MDLEQLERQRARTGSTHSACFPRRASPCPPAPDFDRADRIGEFWSYPESRAFAELLIDCEEDQTPWAVLSGCCERPSGDARREVAASAKVWRREKPWR